MGQLTKDLIPFAQKYIWWKTPDEAIRYPFRVMAQVMDLGTHEDVQALAKLVGDDTLRDVVLQAEAGQFRPRSWAYWHYRLGLAKEGCVPEMPRRRFA
jgi:hypothetical protein